MKNQNAIMKVVVDEIDQAIQAFLSGNTKGSFGRYCIVGDMLVYKTVVTEKFYHKPYYDVSRNEKAYTGLNFLYERAKLHQIDLVSHTIDELDQMIVDQKRFSTIIKYRTVKANLIAKRIGDVYIGNSSVLGLIGRIVSFGNEILNGGETKIQKRLSQLIPMIPFTVFKEAGLDLDKYRLIDRGPEEIIVRDVEKWDSKKKKRIKVSEKVHFTGASLFEVEGTVFLFDVDRREVEHRIFNPFVTEIPDVNVKTITEAYESLKPMEVVAAELDEVEVLRQGEWFFIPQTNLNIPDDYLIPDMSIWQKAGDNVIVGKFVADEIDFDRYNNGSFELRAGINRPNYAAQGFTRNGMAFVRGIVTHSGREHAPILLKTWHRAIPNTATKSFTIVGEID